MKPHQIHDSRTIREMRCQTTLTSFANGFETENFSFQLTGAQKRVLKEIRNDVGSGRQMNRLLQGDVGSGKTLVALMSMLLALDNGYQACMMAPTEILANQHYETIKELLFGMDIRVELLTGSIKGKRREAILTGLLTGDVKILIGTHAVIEDTVNFSSLGFVVISNPMDTMTYLALKALGLPKNRVIGMGGALDSSRFKYFLSQAIGCNANEVEGMVIGGHGDTTMIPLTRFATYKGMPVSNFLSEEKLQEVASATMVGGATLPTT